MKTIFIVTERSYDGDIQGVFDNPIDAFTEMLKNLDHTSFELLIEEFKVNERYDVLQDFYGEAEVKVIFTDDIYPSEKTLYFKFFKAQDVLKFQEDLTAKRSKGFNNVKSFDITTRYEEQTP